MEWWGRIGFQLVLENGLPACFLAAVRFMKGADGSLEGHLP
jgi:hypothetical protein